jgi:hypothetical protein
MGRASRIHLPETSFAPAKLQNGNGTKMTAFLVRTEANATREDAKIMLAQKKGGAKGISLAPSASSGGDADID